MSETTSPAGESAASPQLPERAPRKKTGWIVAGIAGAIAIAVVLAVAVTSTSRSESAGGAKTVTIGVADAAQPYWKAYTALVKKQLNVSVKLVNFADYSQPNPALSQGQLDLNQFQHIEFLADYNVSNHDTLRPVGATAVYPLTLYSLKYASVEEIPEGAQVAIPNDAINQARGLLVLQAAHLLTLKDGGTAFSSTADIQTHKVNVLAVDAAQTAVALQNGSADASIVNNNFAVDAKLPQSKAIYHDDPASAAAAPYVNIFAARAKDAANPLFQKLVALYHDATIEKQVQAANSGTAVFSTTSAAQLQADLEKVEADAKAAKR
ncbi:MetQ/NlpA family ABC transporter substrate-binding protein [Parafrigoribacterium mesophilum]|uniref:MetQ/NlpA family ABC transporter substrate-binding protein n=1 Tax=Parafrigoribacterium mesophilum TaxID=433646 RepID=UPI0031FD4B6A